MPRDDLPSYIGLHRGNIGVIRIMEKNMEATILCMVRVRSFERPLTVFLVLTLCKFGPTQLLFILGLRVYGCIGFASAVLIDF